MITYAIGTAGEPVRTYITTSSEARMSKQLQEGEIFLVVTEQITGGTFSADGKSIVAPTVTLDDLQGQKWNSTKLVRDGVQVGGCMTSIGEVHTDQNTISMLLIYTHSAQIDSTYSVTWQLADNSSKTLAAADIIKLNTEVSNFFNLVFNFSQALRTKIYATTSETELEAIDINTGWPTSGVAQS